MLNYGTLIMLKKMRMELIADYHKRYGHMGPLKVIKAISEHFYIKMSQQSGQDSYQNM